MYSIFITSSSNSDLCNSSLTHVDKKYYVQTNVRDLLSIKSSFQKIYYIFYIEVLKNSYLFIGWEWEHNYEKGLVK